MKFFSMNSKLTKWCIIVFIIILSFVSNFSSQAYVLQGPHILDLMVEKLGKAESLFVAQKLIFYRVGPSIGTQLDDQIGDSEHSVDTIDESRLAQDDKTIHHTVAQETLELDESLRFVFSNSFRSDVNSSETERIHVLTNFEVMTIIDGSIVPTPANRFDLYKDPLLYRSRKALAKRLRELGVDVSVTSLGRFEDQIAWIIGANYPDKSVSQLWIDQETFLPTRWIIRGAGPVADSDALEIRYLLWWKIGKTRYPSRIEFYQDGNLVRVNQAKNFKEDVTFAEEFFDIKHLRTIYPRASTRSILSGASEEPSEIQKTIEEFKRIF